MSRTNSLKSSQFGIWCRNSISTKSPKTAFSFELSRILNSFSATTGLLSFIKVLTRQFFTCRESLHLKVLDLVLRAGIENVTARNLPLVSAYTVIRTLISTQLLTSFLVPRPQSKAYYLWWSARYEIKRYCFLRQKPDSPKIPDRKILTYLDIQTQISPHLQASYPPSKFKPTASNLSRRVWLKTLVSVPCVKILMVANWMENFQLRLVSIVAEEWAELTGWRSLCIKKDCTEPNRGKKGPPPEPRKDLHPSREFSGDVTLHSDRLTTRILLVADVNVLR